MAKQAPDRLRYAFEPRLGKSRALNAGIAAARGAVIALTDDDVSPADDWVATAATVLDQRGIDGAGGRILPRWEADPPSWLLGNPRLLDYLAIMDFDRPAMLPVPRGSYPQVWGRTWCTGAQRSRRWADSTRGSGRWATDATAERMWISSNGCFNPAARWHTTRR
jgi:glycosyltransferase involved in cell wall biosynthesis